MSTTTIIFIALAAYVALRVLRAFLRAPAREEAERKREYERWEQKNVTTVYRSPRYGKPTLPPTDAGSGGR